MNQSPDAGMTNNRSIIAISLVLCLVTAAIYFRAAFFPFCVIDDKDYVTANAQVLKGLSLHSVEWAFVSFHTGNWHPLTWLSLMMDRQLFGTAPMGFHIVNVTFHIVNSLLLFLLLNSMTGALWRSAFAAALFAVHPLHVESVAWISERKDVLSAFFWMLTLICYSRYVRQRTRGTYLSALAVYALGLMAKPMLVTMPAVLLLLDYWPFRRLRFLTHANAVAMAEEDTRPAGTGKVLAEKIPFLALSAASSIVTLYAQRIGDAIVPLEHLSVFERIGNALLSYTLYMKKMLVPADLAIFYQLAPVQAWKAYGALFLLAGLLLAAFRRKHDCPYLLTGGMWYLITLLPVIGLVQVGSQAMADRYTYIPSIGLFVIASWGGADVAARFPALRKAILATGGAAVLAYAIITCLQLSYWKNNVTLFSHALSVTHVESSLAHARMGLAYFEEGRPDLAVQELEEGLRIDPEATSIHLRLGIALDRLGRTEEAIEHFRAELKVRPQLAPGHFDLASALHKIGKLPEAIAEYNEVLAIEPEDATCHDRLGLALLQQGRYNEAIQHFTEALRLDPTLMQTSNNLQFAISQRNQNAH